MSFADTTHSNQATSVLSSDSIRAFMKKLMSPEYDLFIREKDERMHASYRLLAEAGRRGFITPDELIGYYNGVAMIGFLILSPSDKHLKEFKSLSEEMAKSQEELGK